jgi:cephalosporin hydroxylase
MREDAELRKKSLDWMVHADTYRYSYNFSWMGRPVIRYPSDLVIQQEIMWNIRPDLVIETGIAHGGSVVFSAAMQFMMGIEPNVVAIDIDIRSHNRELIEAHPMGKHVTMYQGDSVDPDIIEKVRHHCEGKSVVMVVLDSSHTHEHVLAELEAYAGFVSVGSFLLLPDTLIEFFPKGHYSAERPWDVGNNPHTAMTSFLSKNDHFVLDEEFCSKGVISEAPDGYLRRIS